MSAKLNRATPKTLTEAIQNGIDEHFGNDALSSKGRNALTEALRTNLKDYAAQGLSVIGLRNQMYGTPEMDEPLEKFAQRFDCTFKSK